LKQRAVDGERHIFEIVDVNQIGGAVERRRAELPILRIAHIAGLAFRRHNVPLRERAETAGRRLSLIKVDHVQRRVVGDRRAVVHRVGRRLAAKAPRIDLVGSVERAGASTTIDKVLEHRVVVGNRVEAAARIGERSMIVAHQLEVVAANDARLPRLVGLVDRCVVEREARRRQTAAKVVVVVVVVLARRQCRASEFVRRLLKLFQQHTITTNIIIIVIVVMQQNFLLLRLLVDRHGLLWRQNGNVGTIVENRLLDEWTVVFRLLVRIVRHVARTHNGMRRRSHRPRDLKREIGARHHLVRRIVGHVGKNNEIVFARLIDIVRDCKINETGIRFRPMVQILLKLNVRSLSSLQ
jgi:hypothetical protein